MGLEPRDLGPEPLAPFGAWLEHARVASGRANPNAMTLCTVGPDGQPQGRIVLLKGWSRKGLRFFTNSGSEKGRALAAHPRAEVVFHWDSLHRQLRVRGSVAVLDADETKDYFLSRARDSRLAAWASDQSRSVVDRAEMERRFAQAEERFQGQEVGPPPAWWGYLLRPERFEFWEEAASRFHDRVVYTAAPSGWTVERLFP
ncbi:MAG: pyridoxamine 5'-phosphate oxidase [bacterium]